MSCSGFAPNVDRREFALRPLDYNEDRTELEVEFFWQPACLHGIDDRIPLSTLPSSSRDLDGSYDRGHNPISSSFTNAISVYKDRPAVYVEDSGPQGAPLPSKELLDMQFVLSRLVNLSGAGEQSDEEDFDDPNESIGTAAVRA